MGTQNLGKVRGESAYETWLKQSGNSGKTEAQFLESLKGGIDDLYDYQIINHTHVYRYSDGRMEMHTTFAMSGECKIKIGSFYIADVEQWVFPITFTAVPSCHFTCIGGVNFGFAITGNFPPNAEQAPFSVASPDDLTGTGKKAIVSMYAIGRWK